MFNHHGLKAEGSAFSMFLPENRIDLGPKIEIYKRSLALPPFIPFTGAFISDLGYERPGVDSIGAAVFRLDRPGFALGILSVLGPRHVVFSRGL